MSTIYEIYGNNAKEMTLALLEKIDAASLVPENESVAFKPNLVVAAKPEEGATTHAGVLSGCIEYFRLHGVKDISIIEGSWVGADTMQAMRMAGYDEVCRTYDVPFYDLKRDMTLTVDTAIGPVDVCRRALEAGLLVNLPVLKGHGQTIMTCALKNMKGCLPDREKRRFHTLGLQKPIAALAAAIRPGLTVVDSICGDLDFEEGGNPVEMDRMYIGTNPVQLDAFGCTLMGIDTAEIPYIHLAEQYGAGSSAFSLEDVVKLNHPSIIASHGKPGALVARLSKDIVEQQACSACYANLIRAIYCSNLQHREKMYIGQGWREKEVPGIGIGSCCAGSKRCVKGCPPTAEQISRSLVEWC